MRSNDWFLHLQVNKACWFMSKPRLTFLVTIFSWFCVFGCQNQCNRLPANRDAESLLFLWDFYSNFEVRKFRTPESDSNSGPKKSGCAKLLSKNVQFSYLLQQHVQTTHPCLQNSSPT